MHVQVVACTVLTGVEILSPCVPASKVPRLHVHGHAGVDQVRSSQVFANACPGAFLLQSVPQWGLPVSITNCKFLKPQTGAKDQGPIGKAWTLDFTFAGCSSIMLTLRLCRKSSINVKRASSCQESDSLSEVPIETITTRGSERSYS